MRFRFTNDRPIYLQLCEQLELYIIAGQFSPGERLPSVRDLADIAKVNPNTMHRALVELEEKRLIVTERTNGKFVTSDRKFIRQKQHHFAQVKIHKFLSEMQELGISRAELIRYLRKIKRKD